MEFEWDENKNQKNIQKHGFDFSLAEQLFLIHDIVIVPDLRFEYGEERWQAAGIVGGVFVVCAFTKRDQRLRIISLRRGNHREQTRYGLR